MINVQDQTPEDRIQFPEQQLQVTGNMHRTMTVRIQNMGAETEQLRAQLETAQRRNTELVDKCNNLTIENARLHGPLSQVHAAFVEGDESCPKWPFFLGAAVGLLIAYVRRDRE